MSLAVFQFERLSQVPGVAHAITTRAGGVSEGQCASLNVSYSVGDATDNVDENLRRAAQAIGARREDLFAAYQVHGRKATVVMPDTPERPRCDILVTQSRERTLLLRYADCTPVVLIDPRTRAIGLAHAGWRGSAVRAAAAAVAAMTEAFDTRPRDVVAGIGPAIGPCCYAVGQDVRIAFGDRQDLFSEDGRLDLWEANRRALLEAGLGAEHIEVAGICTQCHSDRFFSHRANGGQPAGRFAALIRLD